eukprot:Hpha_TRINITY_DN15816_c5_g4::TRINITY_DN15816_c5_g4_i1::g.187722::m.187722
MEAEDARDTTGNECDTCGAGAAAVADTSRATGPRRKAVVLVPRQGLISEAPVYVSDRQPVSSGAYKRCVTHVHTHCGLFNTAVSSAAKAAAAMALAAAAVAFVAHESFV